MIRQDSGVQGECPAMEDYSLEDFGSNDMKQDNRSTETLKFLEEIKQLCIKYNRSLSLWDKEDVFVVRSYSETNINWLMDAYEEVQLNQPKQ